MTMTKYVMIPNMWHSWSTECALHKFVMKRSHFFTICHLVVYFNIFSINLLHLNIRTVEHTVFFSNQSKLICTRDFKVES